MVYSDINKLIRMKLSGFYPDRELQSIGRLLMEFLTGLTWVQIRLNQAKEFTHDEEIRISSILDRMIKHEPIQYILGETEFYGMKLKVRPGVLIPRGETEELVDWIIKVQGARLKAQEKAQGARLKEEGKTEGKKGLRVLDIGCGSGAIAIALAKYLPGAEVIASDISEEALQLTQENAALHNISVTLITLDILSLQRTCHPGEGRAPLTCALHLEPFDLIISNPPYVPLGEMSSMDLHVVEYEPKTALFVPDEDPLLFYRAIAEFAASHLKEGGKVYVEIHERLGEETANVFRKWFSIVELRKDIHGKDRMIRAYHG